MPLPAVINFFMVNFHHFQKGIFCYTFLVVLEKQICQQTKKNPKIATIDYNIMIGCLRFYTFIFLNVNFFLINILVDYHRLSNITKLKRKKMLMPINVF
jgi:hypothetical protein